MGTFINITVIVIAVLAVGLMIRAKLKINPAVRDAPAIAELVLSSAKKRTKEGGLK